MSYDNNVSELQVATALGVTLSVPIGRIEMIDGYARVGSVIVADDRTIEAIPRTDANADDIALLLLTAADVAVSGRQGPHWRYCAEIGGWFADVAVRRPERHAAERATAADEALR